MSKVFCSNCLCHHEDGCHTMQLTCNQDIIDILKKKVEEYRNQALYVDGRQHAKQYGEILDALDNL